MNLINASILVAATLTVLATSCLAQTKTYDERCVITEGNGVRVDECDSRKYLSCKDGRCQCPDPANQIYTYRNEVIPHRNKRSPGKKGGTFKKVAAGAVAGVATYHVAKTVGKGLNNGFTTTPPPPKYEKVYSCYSRVGGQCSLNLNNWETIEGTSTSTTAAPEAISSTSAPSDNATVAAETTTTTTTTAAPQAAAQVSKLDLSKIPKCVQYAYCKTATPGSSSGNGTTSASFAYKVQVDFDPRIGVCECSEGYKKNERDLCVRVNSGAGLTGGSIAVIVATLVMNKLFV